MEVRLEPRIARPLIVHLREGEHRPRSACLVASGADSLQRPQRGPGPDGYGECFWPGVEGGQYWWMFRRDAETLEVAVMWSRGGASGWEHVFRATDERGLVADCLATEFARLRLALRS